MLASPIPPFARACQGLDDSQGIEAGEESSGKVRPRGTPRKTKLVDAVPANRNSGYSQALWAMKNKSQRTYLGWVALTNCGQLTSLANVALFILRCKEWKKIVQLYFQPLLVCFSNLLVSLNSAPNFGSHLRENQCLNMKSEENKNWMATQDLSLEVNNVAVWRMATKLRIYSGQNSERICWQICYTIWQQFWAKKEL